MPYDVTFACRLPNITSAQALLPAAQALLTAPPPGVLATFSASKGPFPGHFHLRVRPEAFSQLPRLRGVMRRTFPRVSEEAEARWTPEELAAFGLRRHLGPEASGWVQDDPPFVEPTPCPVCGRHVWGRPPREEARFREAGPTGWGSAIAYPRDGLASAASMVTLMRAELWEAMEPLGLRGTLQAFPVSVAGKSDPDVVALYAPGRLGLKATPYGCETTCTGCERRHGFHTVVPSWPQPPGQDLWWSGVPDTGNELYCESVTWDRMVALSKQLFGEEHAYQPPEADPAGWYKPDAINLFLPEQYQGESAA